MESEINKSVYFPNREERRRRVKQRCKIAMKNRRVNRRKK